MIEQINIALEQKRSEFLKPGCEALPSETNVRKRAYTSIKSDDEEWTSPNVLPSEQDDIGKFLNYQGIAVIELQFYHFPDSDRLRVVCHRLNSLND